MHVVRCPAVSYCFFVANHWEQGLEHESEAECRNGNNLSYSQAKCLAWLTSTLSQHVGGSVMRVLTGVTQEHSHGT